MFSFEPYYPQAEATSQAVREEDEADASSFYPQPPVTLLTSKTIERTFASPLKVNVFYGSLDDFLDQNFSDALITSCYKGTFSSPGTSTFGVAASKCGLNASNLTYSQLSSIDYNLHEVLLAAEEKKFFNHLWVTELMQPSQLKPFKLKHLISLYNTLKLHAQTMTHGVQSITIPLLGKGSEKYHFLAGAYEVIVELIGWVYHISDFEKDSKKVTINTVNIITHNVLTATQLDTTFEKLVPFSSTKSIATINELLEQTNSTLQHYKEIIDTAEALGKGHKWRARQAKKNEQLWAAIRQSLEDINNAFFALHEVSHTKNLLLMCCAANARIIAENAAKLLAFKYGLDDNNNNTNNTNNNPAVRGGGVGAVAMFGVRGRGERGRGRGSGRGGVRGRGGLRGRGGSLRTLSLSDGAQQHGHYGATSTGIRGRGGRGSERGSRGRGGYHNNEHHNTHNTHNNNKEKEEAIKKTLSSRVVALKGLVDYKVFASFQTVRLIGNKTVHPSVFKATLVDVSALMTALDKIISACV